MSPERAERGRRPRRITASARARRPARGKNHPMQGVLKEIIEHKRAEVAAAKARTSFAELEALVPQAAPPRNFFAAVTQHPDPFHSSVIAEIKRKSPSAGWIRPEYQTL